MKEPTDYIEEELNNLNEQITKHLYLLQAHPKYHLEELEILTHKLMGLVMLDKFYQGLEVAAQDFDINKYLNDFVTMVINQSKTEQQQFNFVNMVDTPTKLQ